ncbi:MAG: hypothetical protein AB1327_11570 [Bacillota bacterium]
MEDKRRGKTAPFVFLGGASVLKTIVNLWRDCRGSYGTAELLVLVAGVTVVTATIVALLMPAFQGLHTRAETNLTTLSETGF